MDYLKEAERAIQYLAESEDEWANLKAQHQALDKRRKIVRASGIMDSIESSAAMKANDSEASTDYKLAVTDWEEVMADFYLRVAHLLYYHRYYVFGISCSSRSISKV